MSRNAWKWWRAALILFALVFVVFFDKIQPFVERIVTNLFTITSFIFLLLLFLFVHPLGWAAMIFALVIALVVSEAVNGRTGKKPKEV